MIDIKYDSDDPVSSRLSNFTPRNFVFRGVPCSSIEALLQALKIPDRAAQINHCLLPGKKAQERGQDFNTWKETQVLWWNGIGYHRRGLAYQTLLGDIFDTVYEQDPSFRADLLATGLAPLVHSIGKEDPFDTVLTEEEFIEQLVRLRRRATKDQT